MGDFMGSMFGAQIVADTIAHQGRMNRWQDQSKQRLVDDNVILRQRDRELVDRHNELAERYNALLRLAQGLEREFNEQTATIARLEAEKTANVAEIERLKFRLLDATTELAVLRDLDKQQNPDAYPPE